MARIHVVGVMTAARAELPATDPAQLLEPFFPSSLILIICINSATAAPGENQSMNVTFSRLTKALSEKSIRHDSKMRDSTPCWFPTA